MNKNLLLKGTLTILNMLLLIMCHYNLLVFLVISVLILFSSIKLKTDKDITIHIIIYSGFYILLNSLSFYLNPPLRFEYYLIVSIVKFVLIGGLLWMYLSILNSSELKKPMKKSVISKHLIIIFSVLTAFHMLYFFAFSPGNMYIDSYSQWGQAMGGIKIDDWHPVFSTLLLRLSYIIAGTPILFTFMQVVGSIVLLTYISGILLKKDITPMYVYLFNFYILTATVLLPSMVTLYKDNFYNIALIFMTLFIFEIIESNGRWLSDSWINSILFFLNAIFIMLIRHNGLYVLVASMIIFILLIPKIRWNMIANLAILLIIYNLFTGPLFDRHDIKEGSASEKYSVLLQHVGNVIVNDGEINTEEAEYLNTLMPLDTWKEKYTEEMIDPVKFHSSYNREIINQDQVKFLKVWLKIVSENPMLALKGHLQQIRPLWDINGWEHGLAGSQLFHFFINSPKEYYDPYLQHYTFENSALRGTVEKYSYWTNDYNIETKPFITTLSAFSIISLVFSAIILIRMKKYKWLLVFIPVIMNIGTLFLTMPAYNMRYVFSAIIIGHFSLFVPHIVKKMEKSKECKKIINSN